MKQSLIMFSLMIVTVSCLNGQDQYLWVRLAEDQVITNAEFESVGPETLLVVRGGRVLALPLSDVIQIRVMNGSSIARDALVGAGSGLAAGTLTGYLLKTVGGSGSSPLTTIVAFTVIGGVVGGTISSLEKPGELVDLSGLDSPLKQQRILELVSTNAGARQ